MTLIDTSSIVHFLRLKGSRPVKERVGIILRTGDAAICEMVAVELWSGVGSRHDERDIEELCSLLIWLPVSETVWARAKELAASCRRDGTPVPSSDLVIAACAFVHDASLEYEDQHFSILERYR
jgi:predicted nucleic acid-binding protein